jgi:O-antigen/teichoic acid export membrane protein
MPDLSAAGNCSKNSWEGADIASSVTFAKEPPAALTRARKYCSRGLPWVGKGSLALLDQGLISGSNFLIGILLARWLVPEQYGAYALAFSVFLFAAGFHGALLLEPMSVFGPAAYSKCLPAYLGKLLGLHSALVLLLAALVGAGVVVLRYSTLGRGLAAPLWGVCIATPSILFFWLCRRAAYVKLAPSLAAKGASAYCLVLISLLLAAKTLGWLSGFAAFLIQAVAATAAGALLLVFLQPRFVSQSGPSGSEVARRHWRYGRWAMGTQFVYWLSGNAYYVIVAGFVRMDDVAALRALQNFSLPFIQCVIALSLLVLPWASAKFAQEGRQGFERRIRQITLLFLGGASVYFAILCLFGGRIMAILYAGRYTHFAYLLPLVAAPVLVLAASQGSTLAMQAMQVPSEIFFAYTLAGVTTLGAGIPLTRCWGLPGAAVGILISYLTFFVTISHRCRVRLREPLAIADEARRGEELGIEIL